MAVTNAERQKAYRERKASSAQAPVRLRPLSTPLLALVERLWLDRKITTAGRRELLNFISQSTDGQ